VPAATDLLTRILEVLGPSPTPESLVAALIPETADTCIIFRRTGDQYDIVAWGHIDPAKGAVLERLTRIYHPSTDDQRDPIAGVGRSGKGVLVSWVTRNNIERATDDPRLHAIFDAFPPRNIVVVPMRNGDYVTVAAISDTPRKFYEDDLEFLTELSARIAPLLP